MCVSALFEAFFFLKLSNAKFLVIFPRNADNFVGVLGGILFHVISHVSFTHSSESSVLYKIFQANLNQNLSYFTSTWRIASSDLSKNKFIICISSISHFSPVY